MGFNFSPQSLIQYTLPERMNEMNENERKCVHFVGFKFLPQSLIQYTLPALAKIAKEYFSLVTIFTGDIF